MSGRRSRPPVNVFAAELGAQIRARRRSLHISQVQVAAKLLVSPNTIVGWETGTCRIAHEDMCALDALFEECEEGRV